MINRVAKIFGIIEAYHFLINMNHSILTGKNYQIYPCLLFDHETAEYSTF
jgi:hypothetical protein